MKITRKFTVAGKDPFGSVEWVRRSSRITNPDGSVVFEMNDAEVPSTWSQLATDIMVSKYFRKAGVPQGDGATGPEKSARQVIHRLAGCWRFWGESNRYFDSADDAQAFYDELVHMMVHQMAAPNSPQWFNTGLNWAYGITGPAQGHFVVDPVTGQVAAAKDAYTHPQPHACFIQSISDDLVNPGGIMDLWTREARLFKYGSGTGTNFSTLRGEDEPLSGGGKSSGLMSWLKIGDRAAGAIKSGGTTRRAAKMVCLDLDHPDIEKFINWKVREELKVAAMVEGMKRLPKEQRETAQRLGLKLDYDFNGEAYQTVSGQNSNNSVRIPDAFFEALDRGRNWELRYRTLDDKVAKTVKAGDLWDQIGFAAWRCADPGVQYDSTINAWHTCPKGGRINASNPCSEYMFLDDTACNLASINLLKFYDSKTRAFDVERYEHAVDLWTIVLEISVLMAAFPSEEIARKSFEYRTLGLGFANVGAMLMQAGVAYDSDEARALCATLTAIMCGRSYRQSAAMAAELGAFAKYEENAPEMLRVIRNHRRAAHGVGKGGAKGPAGEYETLKIRPVPIDHAIMRSGRIGVANADVMLDRGVAAWDEALALGEKHGFRNAQTTVIAPTGTIGLLMDCDTTGVEPDFALVKFKKLAGGGYFKIANASLRPALEALGYTEKQVRDIMTHVLGALRLDVPMPDKNGKTPPGEKMTFAHLLKAKGLTTADLKVVNEALPGVFDLAFAFSAWTLGDAALARLNIDATKAKSDESFNLLSAIGLTKKEIESLSETICGTQTIEGAPHLRPEHLPVFDCANRCGRTGKRFIAPEGHIRMMAAAQPFISGAISKTINLPNEATIEDIKSAYRLSWELGLKANALYRDGCKLSQPLSSKSAESSEESRDDERDAADTDSASRRSDEAGRRVDIPAVRVLEPVGAGSRISESRMAEAEEDVAAAIAREDIAAAAVRFAHSAANLDSEGARAVVERIVHRPMRRRLPDTRRSITHKFNIAGMEGYLTVGLYEDGMPGELFITMAKEGSTIGGLMDSLGTATSVALQYGVPIESLVNKFAHQRFEPAGMTTNRDIPFAKSLVDYIFRWLGMQFVPGYRDANAPKRGLPETADAAGDAARDGDGASDALPRREDGGRPAATLSRRAGSGEDDHRHIHAPAKGANGASAGGVGREMHVSVAHAQVFETKGGLTAVATESHVLSVAMRDCQGDAPACDTCGTITVRNGACYKCLNCGHSMGCS